VSTSLARLGSTPEDYERIDLDLPDGRSFNKIAEWKPEEFAAARDRCDVRIGDNSFSGDLHSCLSISAQRCGSSLE
jgi:hypothetical protein